MSNGQDPDWEAYRLVVGLWKQENPIKTTKLQVLLVANGGLLSVVQFVGGFVPKNWPLFALGAALSAVWLLSIARTTLYQQLWKHKLEALANKHSTDARFKVMNVSDVKDKPSGFLRVIGGVSSKYYLLGAPIVLSLAWFGILLYVFCKA